MDVHIVNDPVYGGKIRLPGFVREIIETNEFQRLRNLHQLGVSYLVFPSATHNRAEHCIGTAYRCQNLLQILEINSGHRIDDLHKKCVIIAGLLHDLGHGPFSHLWEGVVHQGIDKSWTHEHQSKVMIESLITKNDIILHENPERHEFALKLITSLVTGDEKTWKDILKPQEMFITEIVNNKHCKIDVDKVDYLARDYFHAKDHISILPFDAFLNQAKIISGPKGVTHIAYDVRDFDLIESLFKNRADFHHKIYQDHRVIACEQMVKEICIKAAAGGVKIEGLPLTEVHINPDAFLHLHDSVLDKIRDSNEDNPQVREAKGMLANLSNKIIYEKVYESLMTECSILERLLKEFGPIFCSMKKNISSADVPDNIPLYNKNDRLMKKTSGLILSYKSTIIYCKEPNRVREVQIFIDSLNNNF